MSDQHKDRKKTAYETSSDHLAERLFADDPDGALSGSQIVSAEGHSADDWSASPNRKKSKMVFELATEQPARFLELVSFLPHIIQDIFYQYFLLGRTQTQIGDVLGLRQKQVWQALEVGVDGIAHISQYGGPSPEVLTFRTDSSQRETLVIEEPTALGDFILSTSDRGIEEQFSPTTPDGPAC